MNKETLEKLVSEHHTLTGVANAIGKSLTYVRYWLGKHKIVCKSGVRTWTDEQMVEALQSSLTISETLQKLGLMVRPGNYATIDRFVRMHRVDLSHMTGQACGKGGKKKPLEEIMVENSTYHRGSIKKRLMRLGMIKNVCSECGLSETWNGKPIVMVLDHINGKNSDHRMENLRMLCPNCNSQQSTFCGKSIKRKSTAIPRRIRGVCDVCRKAVYDGSKWCQVCAGLQCRKVVRPTKDELGSMIGRMSWVAIGSKYSVSDNAVRKWAKQYGLM